MVRSVWHRQKPLGRLSALALGALALVAPAVTDAQQNQIQPNQLLVFISAVDASGAPVPDLEPEEIAMTENGARGNAEIDDGGVA